MHRALLSAVLSLSVLLSTVVAAQGASYTFAYVTNKGSGTVSVIDTATTTVVATIGVGSVPEGVAITPVAVQPPTPTVGPATLWIGLKNSDDQGTAFDLQAEVAINSALVATAKTLCIAGVIRNPDKATEAMILFDPFSLVSVPPDAVLSLTIRTRIGTNPDGTKCPGHSNAVGLRLYYDAVIRPSQLGMELTPDLPKDFFLYSNGSGDYLDATAPTATTAQFKNSPVLNFKNSNPWKTVGTWRMMVP
jgi:YVTN family beta-propeller protein